MKIFAIGWNYSNHNKELNHTLLPKEPIVFMKPDSALLKDGKTFYIPDFSSRIEYETEIVIRINRLGKNIAQRFAYRYYDSATIGIDFTARDLQTRLREAGQPWEISKAFDYSAVIGEFVPVQDLNVQDISFHLDINGTVVQQGTTSEMIFGVDAIIAYISKYFTLKIGDLIFTGTPAGVGPVNVNDHLQGYIGEKKLLDFNVK